ncbi:hypothetical protein [Streptomyces cucumeris]|uniref:hypothetical protein n=1 Tax=Streptomyces cucumeris TaxID=2962890 RepID=UPI003D74A717
MKKIRSWLVLALLAVLAIRLLWALVAPLIPVLVAALVLVTGVGYLYHRSSRW